MIARSFFTALLFLFVTTVAAAAKPHAVIVVGTHHYSPQKTMPQLAAELERLGFRTTVINPNWDPEKDKRGLPGLEALETADVGIFFVRFLKLEGEQYKQFSSFFESGKPAVCFRTSTHAFNYPKGHERHALNLDFGRDAFGTPYRIHLAGKTKVEPVKAAANHPILTGVNTAEWQSPGTLYLVKPQPGITPLLQGTGSPRGGKARTQTNGFGTHELKPVMTDTIAWTWKNKWGGKVFSTSLGHAGDFAVPASMRVMVNGIHWAAGRPVPAANVEVRTFGGKAATTAKGNAAKAAAAKAAKAKAAAAKRDKTSKKQPAKPTTKSTGMPQVKSPAKTMTVLYGNSFVERLQEDGTFEAYLQAASAGENLQFRSLAYSGDQVDFRVRPARFGDHLNYVSNQWPCKRVVMAFGMNEAFAGADGIADFAKNLEAYLVIIKDRHPGSEFILVAPTAVEDAKKPGLPDAAARNRDVAAYTEVMRKGAAKHGIRFVDLFATSRQLYATSKEPLTSNGLHLNQAGNRLIAKELASALASRAKIAKVDTTAPGFESLRKLVARKAYEAAMVYHPANGIHYYGLRARSYEYNTEIPHHLMLANLLDKAAWKQAANLKRANALPKLPTKQASPPPRKPRKGLGQIESSKEDLARFTVADGYAVNLFASSEDHPELINPLQMRFDGRGRLWVTCFASYPVPVPGTIANDKILIFEDVDGDGKADKKTVFAEGLKLPDGFVFYKDGIVVSVSKRLVWLRDTDGDDRADVEEEIIRGRDNTDTHHGGYLARTPQGKVIFNEALFHRAQFETPHGVVRTKNCATLYLDPETGKLEIQRQTTHPNPWKISYGNWGEAIQMFGGGQIIDCDYYNIWTPVGISSSADHGMPFRYDKGNSLALVSSSHFPQDWQGGLVTAHLLATNLVNYTPLKLENGTYVAADKPTALLSSSNKSFRPTDLEFGLDGALYVTDFYYPIIGHAQHSIRDANRDYANGRIWRITRKGAPLAQVPKISGASVGQLVDLLGHSQTTVREIVRHELENRPADKVLAAAKAKLAAATGNDVLKLELVWLFERLGDYSNVAAYRDLVASKNIQLKRAAARLLQSWASALGADAQVVAKALMQSGDERTQIILVGVASHLMETDASWGQLIKDATPKAGSPLAKVVELAELHNEPGLGPEFPLLQVDPSTKLTDWIVAEKAGSIYVKSAVEQDLILGHNNNPYLNFDVNGLPIYRARGSQHSKDAKNTVTLRPGMNKVHYFLNASKRPSKGMPHIFLANRIGKLPTGLTYAKDKTEHAAWAKDYEAKHATVTANRIIISTVPAKMAFNVTKFTVKAGRTYTFILDNPDHMLHNLVITKPGKAESVGELADAMAAQPDAMQKHYVPDSPDIIFSTPQIPHHKKAELSFTVPEEPGKYPYICTFPGHWRLMRGVMTVVK